MHEYNVQFDADTRYGVADRALAVVFATFPFNTDLEQVFVKATLLDALYNTNVFAIVDMARHIQGLDIDPRLETGDLIVVDDIGLLRIRSRTRRHYAFATKYCSWHRPTLFPIFDLLASRVLIAYNRRYGFAAFSKSDLMTFSCYGQIIDQFRLHFDLGAFTYKEIDKFLWYLGKEKYAHASAAIKA